MKRKNILKISSLVKLIYIFNTYSVKFSKNFFREFNKFLQLFIEKNKQLFGQKWLSITSIHLRKEKG